MNALFNVLRLLKVNTAESPQREILAGNEFTGF